jgi:hypothetical protein
MEGITMHMREYTVCFATDKPVTTGQIHTKIDRILKEYTEVAYTLYTTEGAWEHFIEPSYTLTLLLRACDESHSMVRYLAEQLKEHYKQDCVLIYSTLVDDAMFLT